MNNRNQNGTRTEEDTDLDTSLSGGYGVFVHNDDITPYDFVIGVLIRFFKLNTADAEAITWKAHNNGTALVPVLPLSDAQAKRTLVRSSESQDRVTLNS